MALALTAVLADPTRAAHDLEHDGIVFGVHSAFGRNTCRGSAILEMTLDPLPGLVGVRYPAEEIRVVVLRDLRAFAYVLSGRDRKFKHRNPWPSRSLCLFYDSDDPAFIWLPEDGLEEFVTMVHRHLIFEEEWRRTGEWPCEDAPHGAPGPDGYPVATAEMRALRRIWAPSAA